MKCIYSLYCLLKRNSSLKLNYIGNVKNVVFLTSSNNYNVSS